ncbi:YetF domain-containing protein [Konateibacter massiliensis]|uniref:YetF domain-containing protein n=1 Tax=Konateibacter massiliensis TaxID=2002841 RepID=UPI000C15C841|nr:DUF421 domain-containing protein [Konateibacter massiliensis]
MQEIPQAVLTSLVSIITLFILTKLMGNREMSQLSMFDYINGITIGSIAAELATSEFTDSIKPFTAMLVYAGVIIFLALISEKSIVLRRALNGRASILYHNGELYSKNLKKAKMDVNELMSQCRINGYFDISKTQTVLLEPNGKLSILPLSDERPVIGKDLGVKPPQDTLVANVIIDGKIMEENLRHTGKNEKWLNEQLKAKNVKSISDVFLATCDLNNQLQVFKKHPKEMKLDVFD